MIARRLSAVKEDIREFDNWEWDILEKDYPGVPLKHFLDNFCRYGAVEHSEDCQTESHQAFFNDFMAERNHNRLEKHEPEQCPEYPNLWTDWHSVFDVDQLRSMPMKTFFTVDLTNFAVDPMPM